MGGPEERKHLWCDAAAIYSDVKDPAAGARYGDGRASKHFRGKNGESPVAGAFL